MLTNRKQCLRSTKCMCISWHKASWAITFLPLSTVGGLCVLQGIRAFRTGMQVKYCTCIPSKLLRIRKAPLSQRNFKKLHTTMKERTTRAMSGKSKSIYFLSRVKKYFEIVWKYILSLHLKTIYHNYQRSMEKWRRAIK